MYAPHVESCRVCSGQVVHQAAPTPAKQTIAELWDLWRDVAERDLGANTWVTAKAHRNTWSKTKLTLDDGSSWTVADMPWDLLGRRTSEIYRTVREKTPSGRLDKNGQPGLVAPTSVNREMNTLMSLLNYHRDVRKTIPFNPLVGWERVDETPYQRQTYLSDEKAQQFIEGGNLCFQHVSTVALKCLGMRQSEARLLRKSEIDWDSKVINLPAERNKNKRARVIPFASDVEAILRLNCEISRGEYVFVAPADNTRTKPVSANTWFGWLKQARKRSGVKGFNGEPVVTHHLRHKAVTDALQEKIDPTTVMAVAGMSPETLKRYSKFSPEQQKNLRDHMEAKLHKPAAPAPESPPDRREPRRAPPAFRSRLVRA